MAYLSLYRKYRPQTFSEILGQEHVSQTLANAITEGRVAHAYLFTGPRGTGKTSTARILAKALNCAEGPTPNPCGRCDSCLAIAEGSSLDVIEMDAASHSKVDETREILAGVPLATAGGLRKVYVIDEVHMLSTAAFNALLKTLEEPPAHVVFVLATTEAHKVLPTIVSRTQRFDFRRVSTDVMEHHLAQVAKSEEIEIDQAGIAVVARNAGGSVRDALSVLDQLSSLGGKVGEEDVENLLGKRTEDAIRDLFDAIASSDVATVFQVLHRLVSQGADIRQLALNVVEHARSLLLLKTAPSADGLLQESEEDIALLNTQAERFTGPTLLRVLDLVSKAVTEMRNSPEHRLLLEIAVVRAAAPETDPSALGLLGRIERLERRMGIDAPQGAAATPTPQQVAPQPTAPQESAPQQTAPKQAAAQAVPAPESPPSGIPAPQEVTQAPVPAEEVPAPAAPTQESETPAVVSAPSAEIGLAHIKDAWAATLKEVNKSSKRVWGLLSPSRPVGFDGTKLQVEVQSDFHQSSMSDARNREVLQSALHAALGIRATLEFVSRSAQSQAPTHSEEQEDVVSAAPVEGQDPVELVKKGLGAEVIEERPHS